MRIDHFAYQRAARIAGVGLLAQVALALILLLFGVLAGDSLFTAGSLFVWTGVLVWLGLLVVFHQHRQERLEALEIDELASGRPDRESFFQSAEDEIRVASRRLAFMYRWVMPIVSLVTAGLLVLIGILDLKFLAAVNAGDADFHMAPQRGWGVALGLSFAVIAFIVSRFIAGMAKQEAWQNLRGGAAFMVGNALVALLLGVAVGLRFFSLENEEGVLVSLGMAIPILQFVIAAEIVLNFILNLYRPRIPGETPRVAFDSKLLSLFAAPDNLVRSINEAVNYQFGFDVTSSWGYQLLLRSFARLILLGLVVMVILNTVVIVEPYQQALRLARGGVVGEPHGSGVMFKWPWPLQTAEVYDVTRVRHLHLTSRHVRDAGAQGVQLWTDDLANEFDREPDAFLVTSPSLAGPTTGAGDDRLADFALVDAEIVLEYRIREDGLRDYLDFGSSDVARGETLTMRQKALRDVARREVGQAMARLGQDDVLGAKRGQLADRLVAAIQSAFDRERTGVRVVGIALPIVRPSGEAAESFVELSISHENRRHLVEAAHQDEATTFARLVGSVERADTVLAQIAEYGHLADEVGGDDPRAIAARLAAVQAIVSSGGEGAQMIAQAEADRWVRVMDARAEASRVRGQLVSYRAGPRFYTERELMKVYAATMRPLRKYVLGVDADRVEFSFDIKELNPMLNLSDAGIGKSAGE